MAPARKLVMQPGPIEFSDSVLQAMATPSQSHMSPEFAQVFQETLIKTRSLFKSSNDSKSQPIVLAGSGTLGWDLVGSNLIDSPEEKILVLSTGFFSDSFAQCLQLYSDNVDILSAELGNVIDYSKLESHLKLKNYSIVTVTHVDTSTGVLSDIAKIASVVKKISPSTLIVVDAVCSAAVEDIEFDKWELDFVLSASQKAIGVPSGLSISIASKKVVDKVLARKSRAKNFFANLQRWIPVLVAYESGKPAYFATPPVQLVHALNVSLNSILSVPLDERFKENLKVSQDFKAKLGKLGLKVVPASGAETSALTAAYFPENINPAEFLSKVSSKGVELASGIHQGIHPKYFRVGHMGVSALDHTNGRDDVQKTYEAIKESLIELGYTVPTK
ncbi:hypothetical protein PACTADRAFT_66567 [Pachysolen tannophilus NRRL Y-2460]|uniref:alanine--glyoxylate transaminase n=1 Tax=Pachysolen tannophilus NRRL Y-2460 TaxID=669874 RepID=A0A1E4TVG1_PACTA|nr:hypothetical protein PACTADRAFT_66567 [Pachysolen tannophilus NRRL Y-2460]